MTSEVELTRQRLQEAFDAIDAVAEREQHTVLLMCATALRRVHDLYPRADELRLRGTPEHRARVDIHNTIVEVLNGYLKAVALPGEGSADDSTPSEAHPTA